MANPLNALFGKLAKSKREEPKTTRKNSAEKVNDRGSYHGVAENEKYTPTWVIWQNICKEADKKPNEFIDKDS